MSAAKPVAGTVSPQVMGQTAHDHTSEILVSALRALVDVCGRLPKDSAQEVHDAYGQAADIIERYEAGLLSGLNSPGNVRLASIAQGRRVPK